VRRCSTRSVPAIVLTHSQSGAFGWLIADARPQLVKAILAIEPSGPPFEATIIGTGKARAWGPTDIPITYDPPVKDASEISIEREGRTRRPRPVRVLDAEGPGAGARET